MELEKIFFNHWGRLRSGWRLLTFVIINFVFTIVLSTFLVILYILYPERDAIAFLESYWGWVIQAVILFGAATATGLFCGRMLEGLPARALGWGLHRGWITDWLKGSLAGALSLVLAVILILFGGGYKFSFAANGITAIGLTLFTSALVFIIAAAAEEVLFRGYPLQTMTRARLAMVGILLTSIAFAYIHKGNPNNPPGLQPFTYLGLSFINLPFINTALAGLWLAVCYLRTRSLWFPLGVHWSWNWTMGALLGLPVSGIEALTPAPLLRATDSGPAWLTGGAYGVEGGVACTIALLVSTLVIWRIRLLAATPEMQKLTDEENPVQSALPPASMAEDALKPPPLSKSL